MSLLRHTFRSTIRRYPWPPSTYPRRLLSSQNALLVSSPTDKYIAQNDIDTNEFRNINLHITDTAAETLRSISERENNPAASLRISVESGGCHGFQYKLQLAKQPSEADFSFKHPRIEPSNVIVDAFSLPLINGSTIDYATELIGSSFRISDNPQAKSAACGCGLSWELKT